MTKNTNNDNIIKITSLAEFMKKISALGSKEIVYRGQSNKKWEVTSSAYRRLYKQPDIPPSDKELLDYNEELIEKVSRYREEIKETTTDIELLAELQHYGAATSLIDFTKSALFALWVACQDGKADGKVFCLDMSGISKFLGVSPGDEKESIDKILTLKFRENEDDNYSRSNTTSRQFREDEDMHRSSDNITFSQADPITGSESRESDKIARWEPPITNNRILKQDSFFIFNRSGILESDKFSKTLVILNGSKKQILEELKQINNISEETVFPDFYGFSQNNGVNKPYGPQDAKTYLLQGNENYALGKYKEAIKDYDKAIELNPQDANAYYNRGIANAGLKNYEDAIKDYDKAIELNPKFANAYYNRGIANADLKNYEDAIKDYDKAIELNPKFANAYYNRGIANADLKNYEETIKDYGKAIELNPQDANAYYNRGSANAALGNYEETIKDYGKAIELNPQDANAYYNRGVAKNALGKHKEAIKDYSKAIELNPQDANAYYNRGVAKNALGKHKEAIKDYSKAIELDHEDANAYYNRGSANSNLGEYTKATADYTEAKKLYEEGDNVEMAKRCEKAIERLKN